jgi:hypothetical protein
MPTDKHRIAAYLPKEVDEKFQVFKKERGVGDSQALILVLTEFLGVSYQATHSIDSLSELKSELLSRLQEETERLKREIDKLRSELKGSSLPKEESPTGFILLNHESTAPKKVKKEIKELDSEKISLSSQLLARRLGYTNPKSLLNIRNKCSSMQEFGEKTKSRDPDNIAWVYAKRGEARGSDFSPQDELSSELRSKLLEWQATSSSEGGS